LAGLVALAVLPGSALAGRMIESGHDADFHCARQSLQCHFVRVALSYVRNGAPDPTKPVLVLDRLDLDARDAINLTFGLGTVPMVVMDPRSLTFMAAPIDTNLYSAIVVASDITCGGCDLNDPSPMFGIPVTPDSNAILARSAVLTAFFNAGGGIYMGSGADNGDGHAGDNYYDFVVTPGGLPATGPFALTALGKTLGFTDGAGGTSDDINTGMTHNNFLPLPVGSRLRTAETDNAGGLTTLFLDSDPPDTTITSGPPDLSTSTSATFAFKASEDLTTFTCRVDTGAWASCASPATFGNLAKGTHTFSVAANDLGGNTDATAAQRIWSICPGARGEIPGNRVDENCDGVIAPFTRIAVRYSFFSKGSGFSSLNVQRVPTGAAVSVRCAGRRCPFSKRSVKVTNHVAKVAPLLRGRQIGVGGVVEVRITKGLTIGQVIRFTMRSGKLPKVSTFCLNPGSSSPRRSCPAFSSS
jgi:hypothetical protein